MTRAPLERTMEKSALPEFSKDTIETFYALGFNFYQHAKYDQSIYIFRLLALMDSKTPKHWMGLGASLHMTKEYRNAVQCFAYAALLDSDNPYAPFHAAECFLALGEQDPAIEAFNAAEHVAGKDPIEYQSLLTRIALMHPGRKADGKQP